MYGHSEWLQCCTAFSDAPLMTRSLRKMVSGMDSFGLSAIPAELHFFKLPYFSTLPRPINFSCSRMQCSLWLYAATHKASVSRSSRRCSRYSS
jgi:hypothetical protein